MNAREAKEKLAEIRFQFKSKQITSEEAYRLAEEPLRIYNNKAREIAKKYGMRAKTIPNNIIYW